jgi:hypothetical protein
MWVNFSGEPFDSRLLLITRLADKQPAEDQVMPMVKHGSQHLQPVDDMLGQTFELKHGAREETLREAQLSPILPGEFLGSIAQSGSQVTRGEEPVALK